MFIPSVKRGFRTLNAASAFLPGNTSGDFVAGEGNSSYGGQPLTHLVSLAKASVLELLDAPPSANFNPRPYLTLLANLITQLVCVSGVNQMTSVRRTVLHAWTINSTDTLSGPALFVVIPLVSSTSCAFSASRPSRPTSCSRRAKPSASASACGGSATAGTRSSARARVWCFWGRCCTRSSPRERLRR